MTPETPAAPSATPWWTPLRTVVRVREFAMVLAIAVAMAVLSQITPYFLTADNLRALVIGFVTVGLVTVGQLFVLVAGGLDLSVGAVMAMSGTVTGLLMLDGLNPWLAAFLTLALGAFVGLTNGLIVTKAGVTPLIATLGMMTIAQGAALVLTQGFSVSNFPASFGWWGSTGSVLGMPPMVWGTLLVIILADIALRSTRFMRQIYYVGGNERAALLSGIRVDQVRIVTYIISGVLASLAGIFLASQLMSGTPTAGNGLELTSIAAAVIGGASLLGGEGTVVGAVLGGLFMAIISNSSIILGVSIYWQGVLTGVILIMVVGFDMVFRRLRRTTH